MIRPEIENHSKDWPTILLWMAFYGMLIRFYFEEESACWFIPYNRFTCESPDFGASFQEQSSHWVHVKIILAWSVTRQKVPKACSYFEAAIIIRLSLILQMVLCGVRVTADGGSWVPEPQNHTGLNLKKCRTWGMSSLSRVVPPHAWWWTSIERWDLESYCFFYILKQIITKTGCEEFSTRHKNFCKCEIT